MKKPNKQPKIRKSWGNLDPVTKVQPDETKEYNRSDVKREIEAEIDASLEEMKQDAVDDMFPDY